MIFVLYTRLNSNIDFIEQKFTKEEIFFCYNDVGILYWEKQLKCNYKTMDVVST